jgi:L-2-hydroxyglutarate oxidase LhgO
MHRADITVIGAGVVGLAIAAEIANEKREVFVVERNETFGQETSSRNSQVVHAGIYYPEGTLKAKTCVAGNTIIYELCNKHGIGHRRLGKIIVAVDDGEMEQLQVLLNRGERNGVDGLKMLDRQQVKRVEPNVRAAAALFSPSSGIVDSHAMMRYFLGKATDNGAKVVYKTKVVGIEKGSNHGYKVFVEDQSGGFSFITRVLINCAGLSSERVAELAGIATIEAGYKLYYCKGEYFKLARGKSKLVRRLVYPPPKQRGAGLGIHVTPSLDGSILLGPNARYIDVVDYSVDNQQKEPFCDSVREFLPFIQYEDLEPEMAGIRPTLQGPQDEFRDFIIRDEYDKGLPGFINLIGIESPGLTASPAIAKYVADIVNETL